MKSSNNSLSGSHDERACGITVVQISTNKFSVLYATRSLRYVQGGLIPLDARGAAKAVEAFIELGYTVRFVGGAG